MLLLEYLGDGHGHPSGTGCPTHQKPVARGGSRWRRRGLPGSQKLLWTAVPGLRAHPSTARKEGSALEDVDFENIRVQRIPPASPDRSPSGCCVSRTAPVGQAEEGVFKLPSDLPVTLWFQDPRGT